MTGTARHYHSQDQHKNKRHASHRTGTYGRKRNGKGGKTQHDGTSHKRMGTLCARNYDNEPAFMDEGDPNFVKDEENHDSEYPNFDEEDQLMLALSNNPPVQATSQETVVAKVGNPDTNVAVAVEVSRCESPLSSVVCDVHNAVTALFRKGSDTIVMFADEVLTGFNRRTEAELTLLYSKHAPHKLQNIPKLMKLYKGRESDLLAQVRTKYGAEPAKPKDAVHPMRPENYGEGDVTGELQRLYRKHRPEKYANIPHLLQVYKGRESELLQEVSEKYCGKKEMHMPQRAFPYV